jgi:hypothetical protein
VKFNMPILVESSNRIDPSYHALAEFLGAQFVLHAGRIDNWRHPDDFDFVSDREFPAVSCFGFCR